MESGYCQNHVTVIIMVPVLIYCIFGLCALLAYIPDTVLESIGYKSIEREGAHTEGARAHAHSIKELIITHPHFERNLESYPDIVLS